VLLLNRNYCIMVAEAVNAGEDGASAIQLVQVADNAICVRRAAKVCSDVTLTIVLDVADVPATIFLMVVERDFELVFDFHVNSCLVAVHVPLRQDVWAVLKLNSSAVAVEETAKLRKEFFTGNLFWYRLQDFLDLFLDSCNHMLVHVR